MEDEGGSTGRAERNGGRVLRRGGGKGAAAMGEAEWERRGGGLA